MSSSTTATGPGGTPADTGPTRLRWLALAVLVLAVLLVGIDVTVLGLAAPFLSEDLRPSSTQLLWIGGTSTPSSSPECWSPWAASATGSAARSCC